MFLSKDIQMIQKLATGGMAEVWEARLRGTGGFDKRLAIKRLLPHLEENQDVVHLFLHEGRLAAMLSHPNICQIFQLGQHNSRHYIAMEYIDGFNLDTLLRTAADRGVYLPLVYVCYIVSEVCSALDYAHALTDEEGRPLQLIHRDLSPSNIMLSWSGHVKIVDFGIAKAANQLHETPTGVIRGKFGYISPEYVLDEPLDWRNDIFTLGIVFWEMLAGRRLFVGDSEWARMAKISRGGYPRPSDFRADLPEGVEEIAMCALERSPQARYQTCGEMLEAIRQLMRQYQAEADPFELSTYIRALFDDASLPPPQFDLKPTRRDLSGSHPPTEASPVRQIVVEVNNQRLPLVGRQLAWVTNDFDDTDEDMLFFAEQGAQIQLLPNHKGGLAISLAQKFDACLFASLDTNSLTLLQTIKQLRPSLPCLLWNASPKAEPHWQGKGGFGVIPKGAPQSQRLQLLQESFDFTPTGPALQQFIRHQAFTPIARLFSRHLDLTIDGMEQAHYQLSLQFTALCRWLAALGIASYQQCATKDPHTQGRLKSLWQQPAAPYEALAVAIQIIANNKTEGRDSLWQELAQCICPDPIQMTLHDAVAQTLSGHLERLGYVSGDAPMLLGTAPEESLSPLFAPLAWYLQRQWRAGLPPGPPATPLLTTLEQALQLLVAQLYRLLDYSVASVDQARQTAKTTNHSLTRHRGLTPSPAPLLSALPLSPGQCYLFATYKSEPIVPLYPLLTVGECPTCKEERFATPVQWKRREAPLPRGLLCRHLQHMTST